MPVPDDFMKLLPQPPSKEAGPLYHLWGFNPQDASITLENNESKHPAQVITPTDMRDKIVHPNALFGYAYPIQGGYRITDEDHRPIDDNFITNEVLKSLRHSATL